MFGGGRRPPFGGFFGGDDFFGNDPFARDPFRQMDRMMEDFFGGSGVFGRQGGGFADPFFRQEPFSGPDAGFWREAPRALPQGATVEEMDAEEHARHGGGGQHRHHVQEPDDDAGHPGGGGNGGVGSGNRGEDDSVAITHGNGGFGGGGGLGRLFGGALRGRTDPMPGFIDLTRAGSGGASTYSYSSSSFGRMGGADGTSYNRTFTERVGPGGVREREERVRDGRTGKESVIVTRQIGDRGLTSVRTRNPDGRIDTREQLHNLDPDSAVQFDAEWLSHAERGLPGRSASGGSSGSGGGRRIPIRGADDPPPEQQHTRIEEVGASAGGPMKAARSNSGRRWI